jgi:hypothetical protein
LCRKCFAQWISDKYQEKQRIKAASYPKIEDLQGEEWAELLEATGYLISNYGRIKCLNYRDQQRPAILKLRESRKGGYLKVDIDKYSWRPSVHRLVATYFVPNPKNLPIVLHKDNNKQNNHKDNLIWGTASDNRKDYIRHTDEMGIKRTKMSKEKVLSIFKSPDTIQQIALYHNVNPSTLWMIKTGYRHSSITGMENTDKRYIK